MIRILKVTAILFFSFFISCKKDDDTVTIDPPAPFAQQYPIDLSKIETFMNQYHMDVLANDDVNFTKIPTPNTANLTSIKEDYYTGASPVGKTKMVTRDGVDYKIYYIPLREGLTDAPANVDSVFTSYKGRLLDNTSFDNAQEPLWFPLTSVVTGWKEIMPLFKAGSHTTNSDGSITYSDFGAGVMFLPSAFGYYNVTKGSIPAYSPLIFNFKLNKVNFVDNDFDRIDSRYEDINGNGDLTDDDTDGDGKPNYLDTDDDGDGYSTKFEIKHQITDPNPPGTIFTYYYPFNGAAVDNPATLVDETQGIPNCSGDYLTPTRTRKHLDKNCH
ncbi:FKBP-type peptidyl-prolyl cis-trans isomerase [Flavobacterium humi]|uniref:peptidylprolyl isomerase n=1 Tax=Flavobacterium humi TaxID=2562683 RepID=A0A4Z0L669_9FLAO|nr:FKBP-type peptidyl-prolyl cis-trans isomerase [Flavobacterium humi]TGD56667.1 FKBP-type peptidylprolyl isomerase [Flavobacterium humi]